MNKQPTFIIRELAIGAMTAIAITALLLGHDGGIVAGTVATIAGIAGYTIRHDFVKRPPDS